MIRLRWVALLVGLALAACQPESPPIDLRVPPVISVASDLDLADLDGFYTSFGSEVVSGVQLSFDAPLPNRALLSSLDNRDIALAITVYQPAGSIRTATPLASTALAILVHPSNAVVNLSPSQLQAIFSGQISDWGEVGGLAGPIEVVSREDGSATRGAFDQLVLQGQPPTRLARVQPSGALMVAYIAETPNAIGYALLSDITPQVRMISIEGVPPTPISPYPYVLPVLALSAAEPDGALRQWLVWAQQVNPDLLPPGIRALTP